MVDGVGALGVQCVSDVWTGQLSEGGYSNRLRVVHWPEQRLGPNDLFCLLAGFSLAGLPCWGDWCQQCVSRKGAPRFRAVT